MRNYSLRLKSEAILWMRKKRLHVWRSKSHLIIFIMNASICNRISNTYMNLSIRYYAWYENIVSFSQCDEFISSCSLTLRQITWLNISYRVKLAFTRNKHASIEREWEFKKKTIEGNISGSWAFSFDLFNAYSTIRRELDDISVSMYMSYLICCLLNSSRYRSQELSTLCFAFISLLMNAISIIF